MEAAAGAIDTSAARATWAPPAGPGTDTAPPPAPALAPGPVDAAWSSPPAGAAVRAWQPSDDDILPARAARGFRLRRNSPRAGAGD
jgi:hypothetical protein